MATIMTKLQNVNKFSKGMGSRMQQVRVLTASESTAFSDGVISSLEPILIKGLIKDWEMVTKAAQSPRIAVDYLKSFYNGKQSLVNVGHPGINGRYFYAQDVSALNYDTVRMGLDEALELILQSGSDPLRPSYYISSNGTDSHFPGLRDRNDLVVPRKKSNFRLTPPDVRIWIGTKSTATCHYDALENIACCVAGQRRFKLFPPDQFENLYFGPLEFTPGGQAISMVDFDRPDYRKFPKFKLAEEALLVAELEPGDALYIPSMWMHHVEGLSEFNILVNYWWTDAPAFTGSGMDALYHAMLALRDKPEHEKKGWKHLFDYYIFGDIEQPSQHLPEHAKGLLAPLDEIRARQLRAMLINRLNR